MYCYEKKFCWRKSLQKKELGSTFHTPLDHLFLELTSKQRLYNYFLSSMYCYKKKKFCLRKSFKKTNHNIKSIMLKAGRLEH